MIKLQSVAVATFIVLGSSHAFSQVLNAVALSNSDITKYVENPLGELSIDPGASLTDILQGSASAAGGNVELFTSSDTGPYADASALGAFASVSPTTLTAGFDSGAVASIRGLNGSDWFVDSSSVHNTAYGADNLANQWFADFLGAMLLQGNAFADALITGNEATLFADFLGNSGFPQISDPNISYLTLTDNILDIGMGGFLDATTRMATLLGVAESTLEAAFPDGMQVSEVVVVNGEALYSFEAVSSGVVLNDGVDSYSGSYEVSTTIPEASASMLMLAGFMGLLARRKRS